jgi:hypothetical protein
MNYEGIPIPVSRRHLDAAVADGPGAAVGGRARESLQVVSADEPDRALRAEGSEGETVVPDP